MEKVVLGLSGGVDSAVAARLLQEQGYEVYGLYLDIAGEQARKDAKTVADTLGVTLEIADVRSEQEEKVCRPFVDAYLRGETPNPCILCNPKVKFKTLLEYADKIGAKYVSTGHYARAENGKLFKGRPENDQSYMLCRLTGAQAARLLLPLGPYKKEEVRAMAERFGLPVAHKAASMEICFIPDKNYAAYIESRGVVPPEGNFVDGNGNILGRHRGIHHYTIGQRRGLVAAGKPVFVAEIRPDTNEVVLSEGEALFTSELRAESVNWLDRPDGTFHADVRVRHSHALTPALVNPQGGDALVQFDTPVRAPTRGQSAVFYVGDELMGGGFIAG